jgi:hypothetical protein
MASKIYYKCVRCQQQSPPGNLFDALLDLSKGVVSSCAACGGTKQLHKIFDFGLGAEGAKGTLLDAFLPRDPVAWEDEGKWLTFYPFLVVVECADNKGQAFWLPYWHIEEGAGTKKRKYGQFAPFLEEPLFKSLLAQARGKGYLRD